MEKLVVEIKNNNYKKVIKKTRKILNICDNENKNRAEVLRLHFLQFGLANIKVKDYDEYSVFKTQYDSNGYYYVTNNVDADIKQFA